MSPKIPLDGVRTPPLTEPDTILEQFITGAEIVASNGIIRFVAYVEPPNFGTERNEQRIVTRLTMANETWRAIIAMSRKKLAREGN